MRRALPFFLTTLFASQTVSAASHTEVSELLASGQGLIRDRRQVPDDPLAGLPTGTTEEDGQRGKNGGKRPRSCRTNATAADPREVGDLRATLAFVRRGPRTWPCPSRQATGEIRLRIEVDSSGKITGVEPAGGDSGAAVALAKKLVGQTAVPRFDRPTAGTTVLKLSASKR